MMKYSNDPHNLVTEFHKTYSMPIGDHPHIIKRERTSLRMDLIEEEFLELITAVKDDDIIEIADALGDLVYVAYGYAIEMGINLTDVIKEIHESNMSKLDEHGMPLYRADGKVIKGPWYRPPNIAKVIFND